MRRAVAGWVAVSVALGVVGAVPGASSGSTPDGPTKASVDGSGGGPSLAPVTAEVDLPRPVRGPAALRLLGDDVDDAASLNGLAAPELRAVLRDDRTAWLTTDGLLYFQEPLVAGAASTLPAATSAGAAPYPLDQTFALHSLPGAKLTIFIDVDGASVSATEWHAQHPTTPTTQPAWDPAGDGAAFSDAEREAVQAVWARVAEDYASFGVDVTTQDPGPGAILRSSDSDDTYGAHAVVSPSSAWATICEEQCGGVAFLDIFDQAFGPGGDGYGYVQPAWIFPQGTGNAPKDVAEALSHEVGHQLGLLHDGNQVEGYDAGHGAWAPVMGVGYYRPISQWSQGSYDGANNQQDDVAIIGEDLGLRTDEAPSGTTGAPAVPEDPAYVTSRTDVDTYLLGSCTGSISVSAAPAELGANLDVRLRLLDADGAAVATDDPASAADSAETASGLGATVSATVAAGVHYVEVDGVGNGSWSTGYDDYGSLGAYTLAVSDGCEDGGTPLAPTALAATGKTTSTVSLSWSAPTGSGVPPVTGYVLSRSGSAGQVVLDAAATSYTWTGLAPGTTYTFSVAATNDIGTGASATLDVTTTAAVPSAPQDLTATWSQPIRSIEARWTAPASTGGTAITAYRVYLDDELLGSLPGNAIGVDIGGVAPGTHDVEVRATNGAGSGPPAAAAVVVPDPPPPPGNDDFADRTSLAGATGGIAGDNADATAEQDDPVPPSEYVDAGGASVWYSWTAPGTGPVTFDTSSTVAGRDTLLAAYTGDSLDELVEVAGNDDRSGSSVLSSITFDATAGSTYAVAVDGYLTFAAGTGPFTLSWSGPAAVATTTDLSAVLVGTGVNLLATVGAGAVDPVGTVTFADGATSLGSIPVVDGQATMVLPTVAIGRHSYRATFVPAAAAGLVGSSSPVRVITVVDPVQASRTTIAVQKRIKAGLRPSVRITVLRGSAPATGTVVLRFGSASRRLALSDGRARLALPKVKAGKLRLVASYAGNATTRASSDTAVLTVTKR